MENSCCWLYQTLKSPSHSLLFYFLWPSREQQFFSSFSIFITIILLCVCIRWWLSRFLILALLNFFPFNSLLSFVVLLLLEIQNCLAWLSITFQIVSWRHKEEECGWVVQFGYCWVTLGIGDISLRIKKDYWVHD